MHLHRDCKGSTFFRLNIFFEKPLGLCAGTQTSKAVSSHGSSLQHMRRRGTPGKGYKNYLFIDFSGHAMEPRLGLPAHSLPDLEVARERGWIGTRDPALILVPILQVRLSQILGSAPPNKSTPHPQFRDFCHLYQLYDTFTCDYEGLRVSTISTVNICIVYKQH